MYYRQTGVAVGLGQASDMGPTPTFSIYAEMGIPAFTGLKGWSSFINQQRTTATMLSLKTGCCQRSSVDSPFFSRKGFGVSRLGAGHAPSRSGGRQGLRPTASSPSRTLPLASSFHKMEPQSQMVLRRDDQPEPRTRPGRNGLSGSLQRDKISPFESVIEIGGDGMDGLYNIYGVDIIAMRGYEDGALRSVELLLGGLQQVYVELRYPIIFKTAVVDLRARLLGGGNRLQLHGRSSRRSRIKLSAGVGVRRSICPLSVMLGMTGATASTRPTARPAQRQPVPLLQWTKRSDKRQNSIRGGA